MCDVRAFIGSLSRGALVAALAATLLAGCGRAPAIVDPSQVGVERYELGSRPPGPPVAGPTLTGPALDIADLRGNVVVLNSWASWCAPCLVEMPVLVDAAARYAEQGVSFVGLNALDDPTNADYFVEDLGIPFASIQDAEGTILASLPDVPPRALPNTLILDRNGDIAARIIGPVNEPVLSTILDEVSAEAADLDLPG